MYGCSPKVIDEVTGRLSVAGNSICHPVLLPGILAELERKRHVDLVQAGLTQRMQFVTNLLKNDTYDWKSRGAKETDHSTTDSVELWMAICHLSNGLKTWKQQLLLICDHVDEMAHNYFSGSPAGLCSDVLPVVTPQGGGDIDFERAMRRSGLMIRERLTRITAEYDKNVRDCEMIMEGMTIATQLVWRSNSWLIFIGCERSITEAMLISGYLCRLMLRRIWKLQCGLGEMRVR